jgi:hypothetical protein
MKKENIALGIFLVFIVGAGVYFYCLQTAPKNVADTNLAVRNGGGKVVDTSPLVKETGNILGSKITDNGTTTTYENFDWNFSIQYPSSYVVQENKKSRTSDFGSVTLLTITKHANWDYNKGPTPPSLSIGVERQGVKVFSDPVLFAQNRFTLHDNGNPSNVIKIKSLKINNINVTEVLLLGDGEEGKIDSRTLVFIKDSLIYLVGYNPSRDSDYRKISDSFTFVK